MSDPYSQYPRSQNPQGYDHAQGVGAPYDYPSQTPDYNTSAQYPPQQPPYGAPPETYGGQHQSGYPQQGGYQAQEGYPGQGDYGAAEGFGPPKRTDSFGPPQAGGFQHGYEGGQFGAYDASNPQGHAAY